MGIEIPEDLKELYESSAVFDGILLHDFCNDHNLPASPEMEHTIRQYLIERIAKAEARNKVLEGLLRELAALVRGESPRLLDEDCGGDADLSLKIDAALRGDR